jgi:DNA-binding CsgD family transcriptional regulator
MNEETSRPSRPRRASRSGQISELVGQIYESAFAPDWTAVLQHLTVAFHAERATFFYHDRRRGGQVLSAHNFAAEDIKSYEAHYSHVNILLKEAPAALLAPGAVRTVERVCGRDRFMSSEYYNDYVRPMGTDKTLAGTLACRESFTSNICLMGEPRRRSFGDWEIRQLSFLLPHLARALELQAQLEAARSQSRLLRDGLEKVTSGVMVIDSRCRVTYTNQAAEQILVSRDGIWRDGGELKLAGSQANQCLRRQIVEISRSRTAVDVVVPRPSGLRPYVLRLYPVPASRLAATGRGEVMLFVADPARHVDVAATRISAVFPLTPAEAQVARALLDGQSTEELADRLGITVQTARTHVKRVLQKTECRRQSELVRLLVTTLGPHR